MNSNELRQLFLKFFVSKNHKIINSSSLIPNDNSVLFTTAGVQPLMQFMHNNIKHPLGNQIVGIQKCVRTDDINKVGDSNHLTFFEMLGNWSFGEYFKKKSIEYAFEFLTSNKFLNINQDLLSVSIFCGDNKIPHDKETFNIWKKLGFNELKISSCNRDKNWWGPIGDTGPCGPDTEIFYWTGNKNEIPIKFDMNDNRWVEIWNIVFIEYNKISNNCYVPLTQKNIDTGMGLERILTIVQNKNNCYETDLFLPLLHELNSLITINKNNNFDNNIIYKRIIIEHLKTSTFIISSGILPGNIGREYILRRLIRRAIRYGKKLGIVKPFIEKISLKVIECYAKYYPELIKYNDKIISILQSEESKFDIVLNKGINIFNKLIFNKKNNKIITGSEAFCMYSTYGFPIEYIEKNSLKYGYKVDKKEFNKMCENHQILSRNSLENKFKGGMIDQSNCKVIALHTATHILHESLKRILGKLTTQRGSNINEKRLRFDFTYETKLTEEQLNEIENLVNKIIDADLKINFIERHLKDVLKDGITGNFTDKYGDKVKVYTIGDFNKEICGGPHVERTSLLGKFKIIKEQSSSKGIRRIKAILI